MTSFYCDFANQTQRTWTMCVYQTLPDSIGRDSVSWRQITAPRSGFGGVKWEETYGVAIAQYNQLGEKGVYSASQMLMADLGSAWDIVFQDGIQQLAPNGTTAPGQILITNKSNDLANAGFGMSGQGAVYQRNLMNGAVAQFKAVPTYWVGLFSSLQLGEVIFNNVVVGPFQPTYDNVKTRASVTVTESAGRFEVAISYSQTASFQMENIQRKLDHLERLERSSCTG